MVKAIKRYIIAKNGLVSLTNNILDLQKKKLNVQNVIDIIIKDFEREEKVQIPLLTKKEIFTHISKDFLSVSFQEKAKLQNINIDYSNNQYYFYKEIDIITNNYEKIKKETTKLSTNEVEVTEIFFNEQLENNLKQNLDFFKYKNIEELQNTMQNLKMKPLSMGMAYRGDFVAKDKGTYYAFDSKAYTFILPRMHFPMEHNNIRNNFIKTTDSKITREINIVLAKGLLFHHNKQIHEEIVGFIKNNITPNNKTKYSKIYHNINYQLFYTLLMVSEVGAISLFNNQSKKCFICKEEEELTFKMIDTNKIKSLSDVPLHLKIFRNNFGYLYFIFFNDEHEIIYILSNRETLKANCGFLCSDFLSIEHKHKINKPIYTKIFKEQQENSGKTLEQYIWQEKIIQDFLNEKL